MWQEFKKFIARGNVIDLAVAVIVGTAFGKIVSTLVESVLMPPIGLVLGRVDFSSLFVVLDLDKGAPVSLADAKTKGIPVIAYGQLLNDMINFLVVAFIIFMFVRQINRVKGEEPLPPLTKSCPYCFLEIPRAATRCAHCTSSLAAT